MSDDLETDRDARKSQGAGGWEPQDLALHRASRLDSSEPGCGARPEVDPATVPPALPEVTGPVVELPRPDIEAMHNDMPFFDVVEARQSGRVHGPRVIRIDELAEFLFRSCRVTWTAREGAIEAAGRPYPSGGGAYELDVYCLISECVGVEPGLYRYVADRHELERKGNPGEASEHLLDDARAGCAMPGRPQVLLVLASRFERLSRRYRGLAYALTLKNVGVVMQTMCLTATAMGLSACALGTGNSELFARASGADPLSEPAVGELVLGATD